MMKLTKKLALEVAINAIENSTLPNWSYTEGDETLTITKAEAIEKLHKMMEQLDAKASANKKPTAQQLANEATKDKITEILAAATDEGMSATDVMNALGAEIGIQRTTALLTQMVNAGQIKRDIVKRKAYFSLVK